MTALFAKTGSLKTAKGGCLDHCLPACLLSSFQTNENMEITSGLQSEQHVKKQLAKKLEELQEKLLDFKEKARLIALLGSRPVWLLCFYPFFFFAKGGGGS